jgi:hypothetical protein
MSNRFATFAPSRHVRLILTTVLAAGVLTGCATGAIKPGKFVASAEGAMAKGNTKLAIENAEKAVLCRSTERFIPRASGQCLSEGGPF